MTQVIQVTNIAPQATRDQMLTLFNFIGKIEDLRLYPSVRDATMPVATRCCFVKFVEQISLGIAQHLNNTVFIDRAVIISPVLSGEVPEEVSGLLMAQQAAAQGLVGKTPAAAAAAGFAMQAESAAKMPSCMINRLEGVAPNAFIMTHDARLEAAGLPPFPPLAANTPQEKVEEIRRTICVIGLDSTVSAQQCMEAFADVGEVKYFRYCTRESDAVKYALIEFTEHSSVVPALKLNDRQLGMSRIKVTHATVAISKPQNKTNEAAQREIEEAMTKVKEAQSLVSAAVDPLMGMLGSQGVNMGDRRSHTRSRSKSRRRSRSRGRSSYSRRSRSRDRRRRSRTRSRSRDRRRRRSRDRDRRRSRTRSRDRRRRRSRTKSRERRRRSRSRDRDRDRDRKRDREEKRRDRDKDKGSKEKEESKDKERKKSEEPPAKENGDEEKDTNGSGEKENGTAVVKEKKERKRSRSRERKHRSRSRDRKKSRRSRSRSRDKKKRSRSREKKRDRSRSKERSSKSSRHADKENGSSKKDSKISRDYDQEEAGFETAPAPPPSEDKIPKKKSSKRPPEPPAEDPPSGGDDDDQDPPPPPPPPKADENMQSEDMEISNSP